ncbi:AEC family transporter [Paraconexibacter algicola]|uniref:Transporter n=1 Tax=Paraconexibacter algicola TaxID=2133960 RepID=A0A2T4UJA2_9ACTN|nr:AEC family transporter [Paraconexibacter algicola]PTL59312.1 transporter [Paraconexibacter algicola]
MLLVLVGIITSAAAGMASEARWGERAVAGTGRAFDVLLYGLLPLITFFAVTRLELTAGLGVGLLLAYTELAIVGLVAFQLARRLLHLDDAATGAVVVGSILANTGYLGLPLTAAVLGTDVIPEAITWDLAVSVPMLFVPAFAIGAALGTKAGETPRERVRAFLVRNPPLLALGLALVAPDAWAPEALSDIARYGALALLPVGFFALGVHLRQEAEDGNMRFPPPLTRPVLVVLGCRVLLAPALFAAGALTVGALTTVDIPDAYFAQAAMPCGINALIVAHVYGLDLRIAASAVAWSTTAVVTGALVLAAVT